MLLANLGILVAVYLVDTVVKKYKKKKKLTLETVTDEKSLMIKLELPSKQNLRYAKMSGASILMVSGAYFIFPPLTLLNIIMISYISIPVFNHASKTWQTEKKIRTSAYTSLVNFIMLITGNYFAAAIQNLTYYMSKHLIDKSRQKSIQLVTQAYQTIPKKVWVINDKVEQEILLTQVQKGDIVIVTTGQVIPIDGEINSGMALVDQQTLTGESCPVEKTIGDQVMASSIILNGRIGIRADHSGEATRTHTLNKLLQNNTIPKTQLQLKGEIWADKMVIPTIAGSAAMTPFIGISAASALLFSLPANTVRSMLSAQTIQKMELMARKNIIIKDGRVLEELPHIDTILFDKTGTLTQTRPTVSAIIACGQYDNDTLLGLAAAAEQRLDHPIAHAIVNKAKQKQLILPKVIDSTYDLGLGIKIKTAQHTVHIGSQRFIQGVTKTEALPEKIALAMQVSQGHSFILIAIDYAIQGTLELDPPLRPEVPKLIQQLKKRGFKQLSIVSGDQKTPTQRLSDDLGLDKVYSEVLPQDKAALIRKLQAQGRHVCFVGDGINDALAMKQANVSICLQSAATLTSDIAQIVLLDDQLDALTDLFDLSNQLQRDLQKNLYFWVGFGISNAVAIPVLGINAFQSSVFFLSAYIVGLLKLK